MNISNVNSLEDMLAQLPPEMSQLIRTILMSTEQVEMGMTPGEVVSNNVARALNLNETLLSPFTLICILTCFLVYILINLYAEYKVSQRPKLPLDNFSPIGTYIVKYYHNYEKINPGKMRDDIDEIYRRCLFKYNQKEILAQRKEEILSYRKKEKIKNYICIVLFFIIFLFFFGIGIGGVYIGYEFKGLVMMATVTYIAHKLIPFIFPYRTDSYEFLQVKEYRNIIENYELEKIELLK